MSCGGTHCWMASLADIQPSSLGGNQPLKLLARQSPRVLQCTECRACIWQALRAKGHDEMLNTESWRNLETLLSKAGMYTQFLTEQLSKFDEGLAGSAEQASKRSAHCHMPSHAVIPCHSRTPHILAQQVNSAAVLTVRPGSHTNFEWRHLS